MKALCWYGKYDVRVQDVPEPKILNPRDAIIKITTRNANSSPDLNNGRRRTLWQKVQQNQK
jgi:hypothetical protein